MDIRVNGVLIKQPKNPSLSDYNLTKSGRTASGRMTMDLVAKKKKLYLDYEVLSGAEVELIMSLINGKKMFFNVSYMENNIAKGFRAYVGEVKRTVHRSDRIGGWYWTDISFNFIEQ